jgi:hypothetical protein
MSVKFLNAAGASISHADAFDPAGNLRPGIHVQQSDMIQPGEAIRFNPLLCDSASPHNSGSQAMNAMDHAIGFATERARAHHDAKFAFMGDRAPPFDAERAALIERTMIATEMGRETRDAFRSVSFGGALAASTAAPTLDRAASLESGRSMRDLARASMYR